MVLPSHEKKKSPDFFIFPSFLGVDSFIDSNRSDPFRSSHLFLCPVRDDLLNLAIVTEQSSKSGQSNDTYLSRPREFVRSSRMNDGDDASKETEPRELE